jgi:hypothetical protein
VGFGAAPLTKHNKIHCRTLTRLVMLSGKLGQSQNRARSVMTMTPALKRFAGLGLKGILLASGAIVPMQVGQ